MDRLTKQDDFRRYSIYLIVLTVIAAAGTWIGINALERSRLNNRNRKNLAGLQLRINSIISRMDRAAGSLSTQKIIGRRPVAALPLNSPIILTALTTARDTLSVDYIYLIDRNGIVRISTSDSMHKTFTGHNFSFRPYFKKALIGKNVLFAGTGMVSGKRGLYYSAPVYTKKKISGVLVIKAGLKDIDRLLDNYGYTSGILSPDGIIFACSRKEWLFHSALPLSPSRKLLLKKSRQFALAPLTRLPFLLHKPEFHFKGKKFQVHSLPLNFSGWRLFSLHSGEQLYPLYVHLTVTAAILLLAAAALTLLYLYLKKKKITNQREYVRSRLREQRAQYEQIFNSASDGLLILDFRTHITDMNPQAAVFLQGSREDLTGKKAETILSPEEPEKFRDFFNSINLAGYTSETFSLKKEDGSLRLLQCTGTPFEGNGDILTLMSIHDITELKTNENKLKYHRDHLSLINRILRHDINNELMVIISSLDSYMMNSGEQYLKSARKGALNCASLIREMKDFEEFIASHSDLYSINLEDIFEPIINNYENASIHLSGNASVMGNIGLSSVFGNIISNSLSHSGSQEIQIEILKQEPLCSITISDNGRGIPDNLKNKIFRENFHFGTTGRSGLGLYIVKKAITNMGGTVTVSDNSPTGTIFTIQLRLDME